MSLDYLKAKILQPDAFTKGSFFLLGGGALANFLNYLYHLMIGRQVGVVIYGEVESIISLFTIISVPALTLVMVATKYAAICKADGDLNGSWEIWSYLNKKVFKYGLALFLVAVFLTPAVGKFLKITSYWLLLLIWALMFLTFFNSISTGILSGWQKFSSISLIGVVAVSVKLASGALLVYMGFALGGVVVSLVLSGLVGYFLTLATLKLVMPRTDISAKEFCRSKADIDSLKIFFWSVLTGNLAITILGSADMVLARHNLDALVAGQYGALTVVSKIIFFATGVFASVLYSMSAEHSHKRESSKHILKLALILVGSVSGLLTLVYFIYPNLILSLLFGDKYQSTASHLGWFALSVSLYSVSNVIFQYLLSIHKIKISNVLLIISLLMTLVITIFGVSIDRIISIVIVAQTISIMAGGWYVLRQNKIQYLQVYSFVKKWLD